MAVDRSCSPGNGAVQLGASAGQYLEYRIPSADSNVQYALSGDAGDTLFDNASCPPPCSHRWPAPGEPPPTGEPVHTLSMQFFGDERLVYEVDRKSADGAVLEVVKRCAFHNTGAPDEYYEALTIIVS